jgi:hypothetical protein
MGVARARRRRRRQRQRQRRGGYRGLIPFAGLAVLVSAGLVIAGLARADRPLAARDAAAATADMNCTLIVPQSPLSARGLATPYRLTATNPADGPCQETNPAQTAFVQAAVIDPATGKISVYDPLVVTRGTNAAVQPPVPAIPADAVVGIWFGFNGNTLTLAGADQIRVGPRGGPTPGPTTLPMTHTSGPASSPTPDPELSNAHCVAGQILQGTFSSFTQMGACNAGAFFRAANTAIAAGRLTVPHPGKGKDNRACPTTRSFTLIDQDQSDNVTTEYLATAGGQTAQDTAAGRNGLPGASVLFNGSDNGLLDLFLDPALGCAPWRVPDLASPGATATALPLDELQAAASAAQPAALVPLNDPMTLAPNGELSQAKTNTYRSLVDQPRLPAGEQPGWYCSEMESIQGTRLQQDVNLTMGAPSPAPAMANNLFTFLASRLQASFVNLKCSAFGLRNDVSTTVNNAGVVIAACFLRPARPVTPGAGNPDAGKRVCPARAG